MKKIESWLPIFNGFYETHEGECTDLTEDDLEHLAGEVWEKYGDGLENWKITWGTASEFMDYPLARQEYAERFVSTFWNNLDSSLEDMGIGDVNFQELTSPRFYNYETDIIYVKYNVDEPKFREWYKEIRKSVPFAEYLKEKYTSSPGFASSHSNDPMHNDWLDPLGSEHRFGAVVDFWVRNDSCADYLAGDTEFSALDYFDHDGFFKKHGERFEQRAADFERQKEMKRKNNKLRK